MVLHNPTATWLAWEGSGNYFDRSRGGHINGPVTPRQPGSALKPFTYALAFEHGFSPATVLADVPSTFPTAEPGVVYSPRNYDGRYRGPLLARRALAGSENVPAVALLSEVGVPSLLRFLSRAGFTTFEKNASHYGLGLTLGNAEVRLDEMVAAYSAFARGGEWVEPRFVIGKDGEPPQSRSLVTSRTAFWIADVLSDAEAREYVFGRGGYLEFPFPVAVKTGTSQAYHDNWTIGYTREVTVGVWVGNFDRTPLRNSSGVTGAAPIFHAVMLAAMNRAAGHTHDLGGEPILHAPPDVTTAEICTLSGLPATAACPTRTREWAAVGDERPACDWHNATREGVVIVWPLEYREWAAEHRREGMLERPPALAGATPQTATRDALRIASPPDGATYLIDPTLRREFQTLSLRALSDRDGEVEWRVDGALVGTAPTTASIAWKLSPGQHRIGARDAEGNTASATIVVR